MKNLIFYIAFLIPVLSIAQYDAPTKEQKQEQEKQQYEQTLKTIKQTGSLQDEFNEALSCYIEQGDKCSYIPRQEWSESKYFSYFKSLSKDEKIKEHNRILQLHINFLLSQQKSTGQLDIDKSQLEVLVKEMISKINKMIDNNSSKVNFKAFKKNKR